MPRVVPASCYVRPNAGNHCGGSIPKRGVVAAERNPGHHWCSATMHYLQETQGSLTTRAVLQAATTRPQLVTRRAHARSRQGRSLSSPRYAAGFPVLDRACARRWTAPSRRCWHCIVGTTGELHKRSIRYHPRIPSARRTSRRGTSLPPSSSSTRAQSGSCRRASVASVMLDAVTDPSDRARAIRKWCSHRRKW